MSTIGDRIPSMLEAYETREKELLSVCSGKVKSYLEGNIGIFLKEKKAHTEEISQLVKRIETDNSDLFDTSAMVNQIFLKNMRRNLGLFQRLSIWFALLGKKKGSVAHYNVLAEKLGKFAFKLFSKLDKTSWRIAYTENANNYPTVGRFLIRGQKAPKHLFTYVPPGCSSPVDRRVLWISSEAVPSDYLEESKKFDNNKVK